MAPSKRLQAATEQSRKQQGDFALQLQGVRPLEAPHLADRLFDACPRNAQAAVVFGTWRGDEGKARIIDLLSQCVDIVARYQGGANAGHTVIRKDGSKVVFHQVPTGTATRPNVIRMICRGCFVEPSALLTEISQLTELGVPLGSLRIDHRAAMTTVWGIVSDRISNKNPALVASGKHRATGWAIADTAADKYLRKGIVIGDASRMNHEEFVAALNRVRARYQWIDDVPDDAIAKVLERTNYTVEHVRDTNALAVFYQQCFQKLWDNGDGVWVVDCADILRSTLERGGRALLEGAQGSDLGIDTGAWPEVTSSNGGCAGIWPGCGLDTALVPIRIGVMSAYGTSVGAYSGPGEMDGETAALIRATWNESGATTGIPRRLFWPDTVLLSQAVRENRPTHIAITRMDIPAMAGVPKMRIVKDYTEKNRAGRFPMFPTARELATEKPVYTTMPCWPDIRKCRTKADLPPAAIAYVRRLAQRCGFQGLPIWIGNGPKAEDLITE